MNRKHEQYQSGGNTVYTPPVYPVPDFGDIANPTPLRPVALSFPDMAQMMDPSRLLAQREAALARQLAQKERSLQAASTQMTKGYDEVFGDYHNESQRLRIEAVKKLYDIKNPGEIDLNNETEIRRNYQNILRAKDDTDLRDVMGEVEAANRFMKRPTSGLEGPEATAYAQALDEYWGYSDPTPDTSRILKLDPAQHRQAAEVRKTAQANSKIAGNVRTWAGQNKSFFAGRLRELDDPNSDAGMLITDTALSEMTADSYNLAAAKQRGYIKEVLDEQGNPVEYQLTDEGYRYVASAARMAGEGRLNEWNQSAANARQRTEEKSTEMDEKLAFVQSWVDPAGGSPSFWQDPDSKDVREALLSYPNFESLPACAQSAIRTVVTGVSVKDSPTQYRILDTLRNCLGTAKAPATGQAGQGGGASGNRANAKSAMGY